MSKLPQVMLFHGFVLACLSYSAWDTVKQFGWRGFFARAAAHTISSLMYLAVFFDAMITAPHFQPMHSDLTHFVALGCITVASTYVTYSERALGWLMRRHVRWTLYIAAVLSIGTFCVLLERWV